MFSVPKFGLVVDTEQYAGNFERKITAFCTGVVGDCNIGNREASDFRERFGDEAMDSNYNDLLYFMSDEHGCSRPCAIWPTDGWFNNGLGGHFREGDEERAQVHHDEQVEKNIEQVGRINWSTEDARIGAVERAKKKRGSKFDKYPAMMSVIVYLEARPSAEFLRIFKARAEEYCRQNDIDLTGIRLLEFELRIKEVV